MPTGKMRHGRETGCVDRHAYYFGHGAAQNPSWCDRILYVILFFKNNKNNAWWGDGMRGRGDDGRARETNVFAGTLEVVYSFTGSLTEI